jgi:hypothetical protein
VAFNKIIEVTSSTTNSEHASNRLRSILPLWGVLVGFGALNAAFRRILVQHSIDTPIGGLIVAIFVFQPTVLGVWCALGEGSIVARLAIATLCVPLLLAIAVVSPYFPAHVGRDIVPVFLAGFAVFFASFGLFAAFRRLTGFKLHWPRRSNSASHYQFSLKALLTVMTLAAITIGLVGPGAFRMRTLWDASILNPTAILVALLVAGYVFVGAVLPTLSIPLIILRGWPSNRTIVIALTLYVVATVPLLALAASGGGNDNHREINVLLVAQLGSMFAGALTALPLSIAGLRLVRDQPPCLPSSSDSNDESN